MYPCTCCLSRDSQHMIMPLSNFQSQLFKTAHKNRVFEKGTSITVFSDISSHRIWSFSYSYYTVGFVAESWNMLSIGPYQNQPSIDPADPQRENYHAHGCYPTMFFVVYLRVSCPLVWPMKLVRQFFLKHFNQITIVALIPQFWEYQL